MVKWIHYEYKNYENTYIVHPKNIWINKHENIKEAY